MGLTGYIAHLLLKTVIASLIMWVICLLYLQIPMDKVGPLLLFCLFANACASGIASILLIGKRGY
jgi:hypothetical protein